MHAKITQYVPGVGINFKLLGLDSSKIHIEAKEKLLNKYHLPEKSQVLVSVGELSKRKNHQIVIKAISLLHQNDIHFFIAGEGKYKANLEVLANNLGVKEQVHFLEYTDDVRQLHFAADLAILPSLREGLSRAGLEAIRDGVYLLGADVRGIRDYIFNDEVGETFNPYDPESLAYLIKKNIQRPRTTLTKLTISRLMIFDRFGVDQQMRKIYEKMEQ